MGFRDFISFNQALVAKQGWRLLQFPNSLVSKVLQVRYYKNSNFLAANACFNPSFIWRRILWGKQVIKKGIRWCIGNGKRIAVYKDKWLLKPDTFKPISPPTLHVDAIMGNLINTENQWDERKACKYHLLAWK